MKVTDLNGVWDLRGRPQETKEPWTRLSGTVPGCVQLDLSAAGYLPTDLYKGMNIRQTERYEDWEWWYERTFVAPEEREHVFLVFEGVDCVAEYFLNGHRLGESVNMFVAHEFAVGDYLRDGENILAVHITSPIEAAHRQNYTVNMGVNWGTSAVETGIRRAPHSYGWDIFPRAVTSGLWRGVRLEVRDRLHFTQLYFNTTATKAEVVYELYSHWRDFGEIEIEIEASCGDSTTYARETVKSKMQRLFLEFDNPKPWFPRGYGEPHIYDGVIRLYDGGDLVHEEPISFGLRSVKLDRTDSTDGTDGRFHFIINDVEVFCKGTNWVPMDVFHSRDAERYPLALSWMTDLGCNMVRCWGGNVYEDHAFFDYCDRNGIMVWQDFAMACSVYAEDERFKRLLTEEVTAVIRKLRNHPSLVLWAADNENDQMTAHRWNPDDNTISRELLPQLVRRNDFGRPYLASSPFISGEVLRSNGKRVPSENHLWGSRDYFKNDFYRLDRSHFISEIGYHGCPDLETLREFLSEDKLWPYTDNEEWILHSSDQRGNPYRLEMMVRQIRRFFGTVPETLEEFIEASQMTQAEAFKYFIEHMRTQRPRTGGILWWNLTDGWPEMVEGVVDRYGRKKQAYRYIKRAQLPLLLAVGEAWAQQLALYACNDTLKTKNGTVTVTDGESGEPLFHGSFEAAANTATQVTLLNVPYVERRLLLIDWTVDGQSYRNHYLGGLPPMSVDWYREMQKKHDL